MKTPTKYESAIIEFIEELDNISNKCKNNRYFLILCSIQLAKTFKALDIQNFKIIVNYELPIINYVLSKNDVINSNITITIPDTLANDLVIHCKSNNITR